jgi:low temperature requirement protein LtrA
MKLDLKSLVAPINQSVTFIELFFDLVFVFAVTQIVGLFYDGVTWAAVGQGILLFWLVWWAWSQFTWALNHGDTTNYLVEGAMLAATGIAFFMAVALPDAFAQRELAFALPYVGVRIVGLGLLAAFAWHDRKQRSAVWSFTIISVGGLAAVISGAVIGGGAQYWLWGLAIVIDLIAAAVGGKREGWNLNIEHFSERHGLFVIIVLGEALIIAGFGISGQRWTGELIASVILSVTITFELWWSYFAGAKPVLDAAIKPLSGINLSTMARDVFSILHFPMLAGIIGVAAAVEAVLAHPGDPLNMGFRIALSIGMILFVAGMSIVFWRARGRHLFLRTVLIFITAILVVAIDNVRPIVTMSLAVGGLFISQLTEHLFEWRKPLPPSS